MGRTAVRPYGLPGTFVRPLGRLGITLEVLPTQELDSSVVEFILSRAEGLFRNDIGRLELFI